MNFASHLKAAASAIVLLAGCGDTSGSGGSQAPAQSAGDGPQAGPPPASPAQGAAGGGGPGEAAPTGTAPATEAQVPSSKPAAAPAGPPAAFLQCRSCHSVEPGKHGIGPSLAGVAGKPAASVAGFRYSPALQGSGIVWSRNQLDEWLAGPTRMVPGTRMVQPVRSDEQRQAIIDYLETLQ